MKKYFRNILTAAFLMVVCTNQMQGQNAGIGTNSPNSSAKLDITGVSKGLLIPRMDSLTIQSIPNPAKGLLVYDSSKNQLMVNTGNAVIPNWQTLVSNSGWALNGNTGTSPAVNFIGTTDDKPLLFKINNQWSGIIDSAHETTLLGSRTGKNGSGTFGNTAFGASALGTDVYGQGTNTAMGLAALYLNTTGYGNTAIGTVALYANSTGYANTADGFGALNGNTSGSFNTAIGSGALAGPYSVTDAIYNTAMGFGALTPNRGSYNSVFGSAGGGGGSSNTVSGTYAMLNCLGNFNTVTGVSTMSYLEAGDNNALLGDFSMNSKSLGLSRKIKHGVIRLLVITRVLFLITVLIIVLSGRNRISRIVHVSIPRCWGMPLRRTFPMSCVWGILRLRPLVALWAGP